MDKKQQAYNWETQFETAKNIMLHTFSDRVQVKSNIKNGEILVLVDGNIVNTYYNMSLKEYECLLLGVESYAAELERKARVKQFACKVVVYAIMCLAILAVMALAGDNEEWTLGEFAAQKAACFAVIACCYCGVKYTPALAAAWQSIDNGIKE